MSGSLRGKLLAWLAPWLALVILGAFLFVMYAGRSLARQEEELWRGVVSRAVDHVDRSRDSLVDLMIDFAFWDELVDYVQTPSDRWAEVNLAPGEFWYTIAYADFVLAIAPDGRIVYAADPTGHFHAGQLLDPSPFARFADESAPTPLLLDVDGAEIWLVGGNIQPTMRFPNFLAARARNVHRGRGSLRRFATSLVGANRLSNRAGSQPKPRGIERALSPSAG